jgi:hypothetical protein
LKELDGRRTAGRKQAGNLRFDLAAMAGSIDNDARIK